MRILITGASGFVGSFLLRRLLSEANYEIAVILRDPEKAWRITSELKNVYVIQASLVDPATYKSKVMEFKPDVLAHLAWGGVVNSSRNDQDQWRNIPEMLELMETSIESGVSSFVGLGSQAEYGPVNARVGEDALTRPTTFYGISKLAACNLGRAMARSNDLRFSWLRLFSSYGPMDQPSWLIPYIINTIIKGESPNLTAAEQLWDYIHVRDVASAIASVIEHNSAEGVFNLGSGEAVPLRSIIEKTRDLINPYMTLNFGAVPYRPDQVMHLEANIDALKESTGWRPLVSLEEGIAETVNWWKSLR